MIGGNVVKYYVVDESGEIVSELGEQSKVLSCGQTDYVEGSEKIDFNFVKLNVDIIKLLGNNLKYAILLIPYIEVQSCILKFSNGRIFKNCRSFATAYGVSMRRAEMILSELKKEEIVKKRKDSTIGAYYVFNPFIAHCSRRVPKFIYKDFYNSKWRIKNDN